MSSRVAPLNAHVRVPRGYRLLRLGETMRTGDRWLDTADSAQWVWRVVRRGTAWRAIRTH